MNNKQIVKYLETRTIDIDNLYADTEEKIKFLIQQMGYKNLRVGSNQSGYAWIPIAQCKPDRIGRVVQRLYNKAKKRNISNKKDKGGLQTKLFEDEI